MCMHKVDLSLLAIRAANQNYVRNLPGLRHAHCDPQKQRPVRVRILAPLGKPCLCFKMDCRLTTRPGDCGAGGCMEGTAKLQSKKCNRQIKSQSFLHCAFEQHL